MPLKQSRAFNAVELMQVYITLSHLILLSAMSTNPRNTHACCGWLGSAEDARLSQSCPTTDDPLTLQHYSDHDLKLRKFLPIIQRSLVYPVILDANRTVLSLPPIINGAHSAVRLQCVMQIALHPPVMPCVSACAHLWLCDL